MKRESKEILREQSKTPALMTAMTEDQPMFDDIPDASMQQLLGTGTTIPEDDATNPLIAHGLKWTLEECISMDLCRDQPKNTIINFPNGVVPDFGNFNSIWKLLF